MLRAQKVFSKHTSTEIRQWSSQLMKSYQMLHAIEKPMNLDYVKPFSNTSDLIHKTPNIHEELAKAKEKERLFQKSNPATRGLEPEKDIPVQTLVMQEGAAAEGGAQSVNTKKSKKE